MSTNPHQSSFGGHVDVLPFIIASAKRWSSVVSFCARHVRDQKTKNKKEFWITDSKAAITRANKSSGGAGRLVSTGCFGCCRPTAEAGGLVPLTNVCNRAALTCGNCVAT